jgi:hypothetical protein
MYPGLMDGMAAIPQIPGPTGRADGAGDRALPVARRRQKIFGKRYCLQQDKQASIVKMPSK